MRPRRVGSSNTEMIAAGLAVALFFTLAAHFIRHELRKSTIDVYGRVLSDSGSAVPGWNVRVISIYDSGLGDGPTQKWTVHKLSTDSNGRFSCTGLKATTILIQMHGTDNDGGYPHEYEFNHPSGVFEHIDLGSAPQPLTFKVDPSRGW